MLACWVLPVVIVTAVAGMLISAYYGDFFRQTVATGAEHAMRQAELRLSAAMEDSKSVSYDGEVRRAYRSYLQDGDEGALFRAVNEYLSQKFSRNRNFGAAFITFLDAEVEASPYVISPDAKRYNLLQKYRTDVEARAVRCAGGADTGIYFLEDGGELYMVRNILDSNFEPYATLALLCDQEELFQSLAALTGVSWSQLTIDGILLDTFGGAEDPEDAPARALVECAVELSGHELRFRARAAHISPWGAMPMLRWAIVLEALLIVPLLALVILLFHRHITYPVETLVRATARVQAGERGYQISEQPRSREFQKLFEHFNRMSTELSSQFERIYLEQQALQQARLKALQSQINPHFLNNTLEIIAWEARLAENERVCAMIEALSTMLDAAIGRDGRAQISLREEFGYVDAYLYIIQERFGERLTISKDLDPELMDFSVPRLIIQPLVENAVDHDLSSRSRGELCIRTYRDGDRVCLEVEHDGAVLPEDWQRIRAMLAAPATEAQEVVLSGRVGIRNVNQRLRLTYGAGGGLSISEPRPGRILAKVVIPVNVR